MTSPEVEVKVRPMALDDLDAIFLIDRKIRRTGKVITYGNITTEHIFTIDRKVSRQKRPSSYVDLITGDVSELLEFGFVAEVEGHVRGFILGQVIGVGEPAIPEGFVRILGSDPEYSRRGIGTKLVNAISEKYRSKGIKRIHARIDERDKELLSFFEHVGFKVGHLIDYAKPL